MYANILIRIRLYVYKYTYKPPMYTYISSNIQNDHYEETNSDYMEEKMYRFIYENN